MELFNFSFFSVTGWDIDLEYCDIEWFALEMNRDHSVIFEIAFRTLLLTMMATPFPSHHGQQKSLKCSTWMQSQK